MSCALGDGRQTQKAVTIMSATDHDSGRSLDPDTATFVVGADVSPCTNAEPAVKVGPERETYPVRRDRCLSSILAFSSREAAAVCRGQHGGQIRSRDELQDGIEASQVPVS